MTELLAISLLFNLLTGAACVFFSRLYIKANDEVLRLEGELMVRNMENKFK